MLRTDLPSHRRSAEPDLVAALARREPLALAEACSRTLPVAFAVGRRLLPTVEIEALLLAVYEELWSSPPRETGLERWVRERTAAVALGELRERGAAPSVPSALTIAPDLPAPNLSYLDTTERTLEALADEDRLALLRAHDEGVPSREQGEGADRSLVRALRALADPDKPVAEDDVDVDGALADWVLGLLAPDEAAALETEVAADPERSARVQVLRRGRRRIEGLPPTPDLGPRLVAAVLTGLPAAASEHPDAALGTVAPEPGAEDDTGEIEVVAVDRTGEAPAYRAVPDDADLGEAVPELEVADEQHPVGDDTSALGPPDESDPTAAGDLVVGEVAGVPPADEESALGSAPAVTGGGDEAELPSALREDLYAELRESGRTPHTEEGADPYAALRTEEGEAAVPAAGADPDDPFADLREPRDPDEEDEAALAEDEVAPSRSGIVRLLQAIGILVLIAGGIGLGLLLGQFASTALRG